MTVPEIPPPPDNRDHLSLELGKFVKASARGPLAIGGLIVIIAIIYGPSILGLG